MVCLCLGVNCSVPGSAAPLRGLSQEKWFLISACRIHCYPAWQLCHLRGVHANPLAASFSSLGRNKSLCFSESNMTQNIKIIAFSKPTGLLITGKAWSIPTVQPLLKFTPERKEHFLMWHWELPEPGKLCRRSWAKEIMQKEQENLGLPMPKPHSPASSPLVLWGVSWVAELCFPAAAALCGLGSPSRVSGTVPPFWQQPRPYMVPIQGVQHSEFSGWLSCSFSKSSDPSTLWILNCSITTSVKQVFSVLYKGSVLSFPACPMSA